MTAANPDLASDTCPVSCWCHRTDLTDLPWPAARWTPDAPTGVTDPNTRGEPLMCAIEDCEPWTVHREETRTARKPWTCGECDRTIPTGERYQFLTGLADHQWHEHRWCAHCAAAGLWLQEVCGGYPIGMLREELVEHWDEGFRSIGFARLLIGQRHGWHEGRDPVPVGVVDLAQRMLREQVAA